MAEESWEKFLNAQLEPDKKDSINKKDSIDEVELKDWHVLQQSL